MTPLARLLREQISQNGPITVEAFMREALTHPTLGYYLTRDPLGRSGDFVTAPEVSQIFGEMLGLWCADLWQRVGAPNPLHLVELGPGRGTLMADAMRACSAVQRFIEAVEIQLVETSPVLIESQRRLLGAYRPQWHADVDDLSDGPALIIANEFFDALPVKQFVRRGVGWVERCVGLDATGNGLEFVDGEPVDPPAPPSSVGADLYERSVVGEDVMSRLANRVCANGGALLVVDYGHLQGGFGDTLQAVRAHDFVPVLDSPGDADLTAHVNFAALSAVAKNRGAAVYGPVSQSDLLRRLGAETRAAALAREKDAAVRQDIVSGLQRLIDPAQMGDMFKAMAVTHPNWPAPDGFQACS